MPKSKAWSDVGRKYLRETAGEKGALSERDIKRNTRAPGEKGGITDKDLMRGIEYAKNVRKERKAKYSSSEKGVMTDKDRKRYKEVAARLKSEKGVMTDKDKSRR